MPKKFSRLQQINKLIQIELAFVLQQEAEDIRFKLITITEVSVSPDLSHAKIFISFLQEGTSPAEVVQTLNKASKYLRFLLAERIKLRIVPQLRFIFDDSAVKGERISTLLNKVIPPHSEK